MASEALKKLLEIQRSKRTSNGIPIPKSKEQEYVKKEDYTNSLLKMDMDLTDFQAQIGRLNNMIKNIQLQNALGIQALGNIQATSGSTNVISTGNYLYFGTSDSDGSWRLYVGGNDLIVERRESGIWVEKGRFTA